MNAVSIAVGKEVWTVPRGFGAAYKRAANEPASASVLSDVLSLVGYVASPEAIEQWSLRVRVEAEVHAINEHLRASDNPLPRHPRPQWMPDPWLGPYQGDGVFGGPSGTVLGPT